MVMAVGTTTSLADRPSADTIASAAAGQRDAIETFVCWAWPRAHRVAYMLTRDRLASDDIAQEAVIAAVRSLNGFDRTRDPQPWLERIAANRSIDWLRRAKRRREVELHEEELLPDDGELVRELATIVDRALSPDLMEALQALTDLQRESVVLRHLLDYRPAEIAEMLDLPAATVRTHIHRGLLRLRERLQQDERRTA